MSSKWDETADFVIVGAGGGAMAAGLFLKSIGKNPVVLEKTDKLGGSTAMSGGVLWVPAHPLQARDGVEDSIDAGRRYLQATVGAAPGPGSTPERIEAFLQTGPRLVSWLEEQGLELVRADGWSDYYDDRDGGVTRGRSLGSPLLDARKMGPLFDRLRLGPLLLPIPVDQIRNVALAMRTLAGVAAGAKLLLRLRVMAWRGKPILSYGASLQGRLLMIATKAGVDFRERTGVKDLIEEDGRIVGVVATDPQGDERRIRAVDGVLINAGGFSHNAAMRRKYGPQPGSTVWTNANPGDTGEMIEVAARRGAALGGMEEAWWVPSTFPPGGGPPSMHSFDMSKPHAIMVNRHGRRFVNESASYMETGKAIYANNPPAFMILESRHRRRYPWGSLAPGLIPKAWVESGYCKVADTIRELAEKAGIDPDGLEAEVKCFNSMAEKGQDLAFHRGERGYDRWFGDPRHGPNPNLGAIERGPFYAIEIYPGDVGTCGGIMTDEHGRVLRQDGSAIPGLYATGNSTASVMGHIYPGAGASIAASFVFAWRAAHHAVGRIIN